jgi:hypothetical protein
MKDPSIYFQWFFPIWGILGIGTFVFYSFNRNVTLKRKIHPWLVSGIGFVFWLFIIWVGFPLPICIGALLVIALITILNIKMIQFCDHCGKTIQSGGFSKIKYCPKCGNEINREN